MERKEGKRRGRHKTYYMEEKTGKGVRKGRNDQRCLLSALHCELAGRLPFLSTTINHEANTRERTKLSVSSFLLSTMNSLVTPFHPHGLQSWGGHQHDLSIKATAVNHKAWSITMQLSFVMAPHLGTKPSSQTLPLTAPLTPKSSSTSSSWASTLVKS